MVQRNGTGPCGYHGVTYTSLGGGILAPLGPIEIVDSVQRDSQRGLFGPLYHSFTNLVEVML